MNRSAFTESSILNKLSIKIDDNTISSEDIVTSEIYWDRTKFSVNGNIIIKDSCDLTNLLPLDGTNIIEIYIEDSWNEHYTKKFIIIDVMEVKENDRFKSFKFEFIDILSYNMVNTYMSKSFKNTTYTEILEYYFKKFGWDKLIHEDIKITFSDTKTILDYIVVPQDRNFLEYFIDIIKYIGYTLYQTKTEIVLIKKDNLIPNKLKTLKKVYSQFYFNSDHPFKIHDVKVSYNKILNKNMSTPISKTFNFVHDEKTMKYNDTTLVDVYDDIKMNSLDMSKVQITNGVKLITQAENTYDAFINKTRDSYIDLIELKIVVVGNVKYNDIYQIVDTILFGNINHISGQNEGDVAISGKYMCAKIVDKITAGKMLQQLTLIRPDFQENI